MIRNLFPSFPETSFLLSFSPPQTNCFLKLHSLRIITVFGRFKRWQFGEMLIFFPSSNILVFVILNELGYFLDALQFHQVEKLKMRGGNWRLEALPKNWSWNLSSLIFKLVFVKKECTLSIVRSARLLITRRCVSCNYEFLTFTKNIKQRNPSFIWQWILHTVDFHQSTRTQNKDGPQNRGIFVWWRILTNRDSVWEADSSCCISFLFSHHMYLRSTSLIQIMWYIIELCCDNRKVDYSW